MPSLPNNVTFISAIQDMTVSGVVGKLSAPPESLDRIDLPASFPMMPSGSLSDRITSCTSDSKSRSINYVICIMPYAQSNNTDNYNRLAGLMDNLESALDTTLKTAYNF